MFRFFRRRPRLIDQAIESVYGANPPERTADVDAAVTLASQLLGERFQKEDLASYAKRLSAGPMPYSTHDLGVSVALGIFKDVPTKERMELFDVQLAARMTVLEWAKQRKVNPLLAQAFEHTL